jgi:hypothetical protein
MNFSLTVIGLHVCYNQEILVNTAADYRRVIYETVYFCIGGGGGQFSVPSWNFGVANPFIPIFSSGPPSKGDFFQMNCPPPLLERETCFLTH